MTHPALQALKDLADFKDLRLETLERFRDEIWNVQVWLPGKATPVGNGQVWLDFHVDDVAGRDVQAIPVHLVESQAREKYGDDGCCTVRFSALSQALQNAPWEVIVVVGTSGHLIHRDTLLYLQQLMESEIFGLPMSKEESAEFDIVLGKFAKQAFDYCRRHPDVRRLHLGILLVTGIKPALLGVLDTVGRYREKHLQAITALHQQAFKPEWHFSLFDTVSMTDLARTLTTDYPAWFDAKNCGLWARLKRRLNPPAVPVIENPDNRKGGIDGRDQSREGALPSTRGEGADADAAALPAGERG